MSAPSATPINFANYTLKVVDNLLTATPRKGGGPAVSIDLNLVIGNDSGRLKFGGKDFAKASKEICIVEKAGSHWLQADCLTKQGTYNKSELKLDGSLQITIPTKHHAKESSTGLSLEAPMFLDLEKAPMFLDLKDCGPNEETMVILSKDKIEEKLEKKFTKLRGVKYSTQVVAGTNYFIKVLGTTEACFCSTRDEVIHLKIHKPVYPQPPQIMDITTGHDMDSPW